MEYAINVFGKDDNIFWILVTEPKEFIQSNFKCFLLKQRKVGL